MQIKLSVEGMTCGHCVRRVENALKEVPGVKEVHADLEGKSVSVELDPGREVDLDRLRTSVEDAGYDVTGIMEL